MSPVRGRCEESCYDWITAAGFADSPSIIGSPDDNDIIEHGIAQLGRFVTRTRYVRFLCPDQAARARGISMKNSWDQAERVANSPKFACAKHMKSEQGLASERNYFRIDDRY